jgi:signal transduction histidine kinase
MTDCEYERARLSQILHDEIGQLLMALNLELYWLTRECRDNTNACSRVDAARRTVTDIARAVRRLAAEFRPVIGGISDLRDVMLHIAERLRAEGLSLRHRIDNGDSSVTPEFAIAVYRVLLQTLTSLAEGGPAQLDVRMTIANGILIARICDDPVRVREGGKSWGYAANFQEILDWLEVLDGDIQLDRTPSSGSKELARISLPLF